MLYFFLNWIIPVTLIQSTFLYRSYVVLFCIHVCLCVGFLYVCGECVELRTIWSVIPVLSRMQGYSYLQFCPEYNTHPLCSHAVIRAAPTHYITVWCRCDVNFMSDQYYADKLPSDVTAYRTCNVISPGVTAGVSYFIDYIIDCRLLSSSFDGLLAWLLQYQYYIISGVSKCFLDER